MTDNTSNTLKAHSNLRFILVETSHPGNVGSVARAMKTMGFSQLILVNPKIPDVLEHPEAISLASGAVDILEQAIIVSHIREATQDCKITAAVSARLREFSPPILTPRQFAEELRLATSIHAALILGNERFGLPNEIVQDCNYLINIPANPIYSSLNLAQAVQVLAYECRTTWQVDVQTYSQTKGSIGFKGDLATMEEVEGMFNHLQQGLIAIDFLDINSPKKLMTRLKRLFARTQLEVEEVNILRGSAKKMLDKKLP